MLQQMNPNARQKNVMVSKKEENEELITSGEAGTGAPISLISVAC